MGLFAGWSLWALLPYWGFQCPSLLPKSGLYCVRGGSEEWLLHGLRKHVSGRTGSSPRRQESRPALGRGWGVHGGSQLEGRDRGTLKPRLDTEPMSLEMGDRKWLERATGPLRPSSSTPPLYRGDSRAQWGR